MVPSLTYILMESRQGGVKYIVYREITWWKESFSKMLGGYFRRSFFHQSFVDMAATSLMQNFCGFRHFAAGGKQMLHAVVMVSFGLRWQFLFVFLPFLFFLSFHEQALKTNKSVAKRFKKNGNGDLIRYVTELGASLQHLVGNQRIERPFLYFFGFLSCVTFAVLFCINIQAQGRQIS